MGSNKKLLVEQSEPFSNLERYLRIAGKLIYLTIIKLDLSFVGCVVNQFMQAPCIVNCNNILRN